MSLLVFTLSKRANGGRDAVVAGCPSAVRVPGTGATTEPSVLTGIPQIIVSFVGGAVV